MVARCGMLVVTGDAEILLVAMGDILCRVIFSSSLGSSLIVASTFSVIVFLCVLLFLFPLAIAIV